MKINHRSMWHFHSFDGHGHICGHFISLLVKNIMVLYNTSFSSNFVFIFAQICLNCFSDRQVVYDRSQGERDIFKDKIELHREESVCSDYGFLESRKFTMFFVVLTSAFFFFFFVQADEVHGSTSSCKFNIHCTLCRD
jgi:hypothetical protein